MTLRRARLTAAAVALGFLPVVLFPQSSGARAPAEGQDCSSVTSGTTDILPVTGVNDASEELQVPEAAALARKAGTTPGKGVTVVVVDSGITGLASQAPSTLASGHGLVVGSIIAGPDQPKPAVPVGIAPGARLVDARFYDKPRAEGSDDGLQPPMSGSLEQALNAVAAQRRTTLKGRTIVVIPAEVLPTEGLRKAVGRLVRSGALVIAAAGDRPGGDRAGGDPAADESFLKDYAGAPRPGEDAVFDVWPAGDDGVVSVGVSVPGSLASVLRNSGVDLAAPGTGSVAKGLNGKWCVVTTISSHWAAAQVAGVAALVWSVHKGDSANEIRNRLQGTASGNGGDASPLTGYGVVQPVEALLRDTNGMFAEGHEAEAVPRAKVPRERADLLADARDNAVWWGLGGGGALVILLVLRPVLARRRA
ncbi:MAG: S8 family serine peptidase [Propionibacteriales bacterium]|nr:S8 family serine peptidase [Propionibacteriales bacterium]